ncbi:hypothetical protein BKP35_09075 [Anaerobacillus arseniciselenatis]|uniref:Histidine kinase/HSP90-like ATPase domain-containing protein n=1 Tax=Anaerobacillus arseniciselenatis TaxID=85682 RepID=A0A1S2LNZ1_9BACI|nr:ATP-binding protein [Anaerobacillus arseniciselenatis]OIJ13377.1 hypothetical protein BKP35_09075 [Anaerobacillus arseniciselenatis]
MPLFHKISSFMISSMEEYQDLCIRLEKQIEMICNKSTVFLTQIAVKEALNNGIEHGAFPVHIEFTNLPTGELLIKVRDNGQGFLVKDKIGLIREKGPDQLLEEQGFEERGRGLLIMHKAVRNVKFNEKGNEVSLVIAS